MAIQVLPKHVADLIAAGEVVERPASVLKELLENAIDAGASAVTAEIKNGGITYIRVTDNGCGIPRADVPTAFLSHATSKINGEGDLEGISTLGFRGEALASVAAVSRVEIMTRAEGEFAGTRFRIEGGAAGETEDAGCPTGATVVVRDLFFNTPARMKFLKKDVSEANAAAGVADRIALSHPEVSLRFIRDGKQTLLTPGDGRLDSAIYAVFGREFAEGLMGVGYELGGIAVSGYVSRPLCARANRVMQFFFINGRLVRSRTCAAALEEAYKNSVAAGKFPACVLHLRVPHESVDVNVHPAKTEVRFTNERPVFDAVYHTVKNALSQGDERPRAELGKIAAAAVEPAREPAPEQLHITQGQKSGFWRQMPAAEFKNPGPEPAGGPARVASPARDYGTRGGEGVPDVIKALDAGLPETKNDRPAGAEKSDGPAEPFKIIGEIFKTYILAQQGDGMLVIDKHAAHERIIFDRIKNGGSVQSQTLLAPVAVHMSKEECDAVLQNAELLEEAGFLTEDFGGGTVMVREVPFLLEDADIVSVIHEIAGGLLAQRNSARPEALERMWHSVACRAAVKAGDATSYLEMQKLFETVLSTPSLRYCPHGRPVMITVSKREWDRQFGRG